MGENEYLSADVCKVLGDEMYQSFGQKEGQTRQNDIGRHGEDGVIYPKPP